MAQPKINPALNKGNHMTKYRFKADFIIESEEQANQVWEALMLIKHKHNLNAHNPSKPVIQCKVKP